MYFNVKRCNDTEKSKLIYTSSVTFFFFKKIVLAIWHMCSLHFKNECSEEKWSLGLTYLSIGFQVQLDDVGPSYASLVQLVMETCDQNILGAHISEGIWSPLEMTRGSFARQDCAFSGDGLARLC